MQTEMLPVFVTVNLLGVVGIVVWHLQGRSRPTARLIVQIMLFLAMTAAVVLAGRNPFQYEAPHIGGSGTLVVTAKILWWTHLAWAAIGFVRIYIVLDGRPKEARLLQDLIVALVYLGVGLSIMAFVFGAPIGTLLATSGVVAIILGLALQNTLGDVFSGIALTLGRPYVIGDWISLPEGTEGRVVASNWRSTYLLTSSNNLVVLPNSVLAKQGLTNLSKPDEAHQISLTVHVRAEHRPSVILDTMQDALAGCNSVIRDPAPSVSLRAINAAYTQADLLFHVPGPSHRNPIRNEVIEMVFKHCRANGVELAMPPNSSYLVNAAEPASAGRAPSLVDEGEDTGLELAKSAKVRSFAKGELIGTEGSGPDGLLVIRTGIVELRRGTQVTRLSPGDVVIGSVLSDNAGVDEVRAFTRVTADEISPEALEQMMERNSALMESLKARSGTSHSITPAPSPDTAGDNARPDFAHAVRSLFRRDAAEAG
ncbi:mechanosensitive ion channel family protein [Rhizobium sp. Root1220]|uniref:mechanosensitive ion channel family protein n=1 Tax=Rhizobium sp. Root1220 TaxID=1736432 RepID=UPI0006FBC1C3|nr:mechanosensitive ion channel family protein [Rhizobium sp. Root1220]KQV73254.1 hypothetical protein ASC90_07605 [Rhizobium sp. Root1220]